MAHPMLDDDPRRRDPRLSLGQFSLRTIPAPAAKQRAPQKIATERSDSPAIACPACAKAA